MDQATRDESSVRDMTADGVPSRRSGAFLNELASRTFASWQASLVGRIFGFLSAVVVLFLTVRLITKFVLPDRERLWAADNLDLVVTNGLGLIGVVAVVWLVASLLPSSIFLRRLSQNSMRLATALLVILTFYAGYASFRNQGRLSSEAALNDAGYDLFAYEMDKTEIRCLYFNYGHSDPDGCLEVIVSKPEMWSLAIFYVEESWFQLKNARDEQRQWGSKYAEQIKYWAQDVGRDPAGLFSYYLISSEKSLESAQQTMVGAGVSIVGICAKYRRVWKTLYRHGKHPPMVSAAAKSCARLSPVDHTILSMKTLQIQDED